MKAVSASGFRARSEALQQHRNTTGLVNGSDLLSQSEYGGDVARVREITIGNIPANVTANLNASLNANVDRSRPAHNQLRDAHIMIY